MTAVADARPCPACSCARRRAVGSKAGYVLWRCDRCRAVFTHERADCPALGELYDHYYDRAGFTTPPAVADALDALVVSCEPYRRTGRWLDVGYGEGALLTAVGHHGWGPYGTELSPAALRYGAGRGWAVAADPGADPRFPAGGFDVVSMVEVLEHVPEPRRLLADAARWLRPGGLLYLTTPNAAGLNARLLGLGWSVVAPPEHLTLWTPCGVRAALAAGGFRTAAVRTHGFNPGELLARWRARGGPGGPVAAPARNEVAQALNAALSTSPLRRAVKRTANRCLAALRIGDTLKVWAIRRGPGVR